MLGTACGHCSRCMEELKKMKSRENPNESLVELAKKNPKVQQLERLRFLTTMAVTDETKKELVNGVPFLINLIDSMSQTMIEMLSQGKTIPKRDTRPTPVQIGEFTIMNKGASDLWICNANGEGMQTNAHMFEKVVDAYWNANF